MDKNIQAFAKSLREAEQARLPVPPLTAQNTGLDLDDAYAIQLANVQYALGLGHTISGKKIGLTSEGIQKQLGVGEPDYGHLFASMQCHGGLVDTSQLMQPKIEGELAFFLKADLSGGNITAEQARDATEYVVAAFEVVDSRVADWDIKLVDTVADNASSGRYILGDKRVHPADIDLSAIQMALYKNGVQVEQGSGSAVLGDPCNAVAWLANRLWHYGVTLKKGEVVLSGAFSAAPAAVKGDLFVAEFSTFGKVEARFA